MKTEALKIAEGYFELSNERNLEGIEKLLTGTTTYSSQNTGVYLGAEQIMEMKQKFYGSFKEVKWEVLSVEEKRPGVILFDFIFSGVTLAGEVVKRPGLEYVIVYQGKFQHIEVRNK